VTRANNRTTISLTAIVVVHVIVSVVHGAAHAGADVPLSAAQSLFILLVILGGPLAGLVIHVKRPGSTGAWVIAATMAGALAFGVVNHFAVDGADRVDHVAGAWAATFQATAGLLAAIEAAGVAIGIAAAIQLLGRVRGTETADGRSR
jgi:hypothetical protein